MSVIFVSFPIPTIFQAVITTLYFTQGLVNERFVYNHGDVYISFRILFCYCWAFWYMWWGWCAAYYCYDSITVDITNYPISVSVTYKWSLQVVCEIEGRDCVSLDVLRQYPGSKPSHIECSGSSYLKRYCDHTLIEDVIIRCKAAYRNGTNYVENTSVKAEILI